MEYLQKTMGIIQELVYLYPFAMSWIWMAGALIFYIVRERHRNEPDVLPKLHHYPDISVLVPCHNEGAQIRETIAALEKINYPRDRFEVVAINDGSKDDTGAQLEALAERYAFLKVIHLANNMGKALALRTGALIAKGKYLVCIDGDAILEPNAVAWLAARLQMRPQVGAVTGNPRIRNRTTLLGRLQVGEFTTIIGLIKRTQNAYGRIFTLAGVVAAFRREALHDVGYWSPDMITDDIDITWNLQRKGWYVLYEPNAVCWILMPETIKGLWRQRLRWSQGSAEAALKYGWSLFRGKGRRMLPILFEYGFSLIWSHFVLLTLAAGTLEIVFQYRVETGVSGIIPSHWAVLLGMTFLLQSMVSFFIERRFEPRIIQYYWWMIWYPLGYWLIMAATATLGFYRAIFLGRKKLATWVSPDRGIR